MFNIKHFHQIQTAVDKTLVTVLELLDVGVVDEDDGCIDPVVELFGWLLTDDDVWLSETAMNFPFEDDDVVVAKGLWFSWSL